MEDEKTAVETPETEETAEEVEISEPSEETGGTEGEEKEETGERDFDFLEPEPKKKKSREDRIAELTYKRREAERQAEYWKRKAEEKESKADTPEDEGAPKVGDYDDHIAYIRDLVDHELKKRDRTAREKELAGTFEKRANALRERFEDYDEVTQARVFTDRMRNVLYRSENGPQLAYYLGKPENRNIALRIAGASDDMVAYEIGKLEQNLLSAAKTRKSTNAPPPVKPLTPASKPAVGEIADDDEWFKQEKQRQLEKLKKKLGG